MNLNFKGIFGHKSRTPSSNSVPSTKAQPSDSVQVKQHGLKELTPPKRPHLKPRKIVGKIAEKLINLGHNKYVRVSPDTLNNLVDPEDDLVSSEDESCVELEGSEAPGTPVKTQERNNNVSGPNNRQHPLQMRQENRASRWPEAGGVLGDKEFKILCICRNFKDVLIDAIGEDDGAYNAFTWLDNQLNSTRFTPSHRDLAPIAELAIPHLINNLKANPKAIKVFCDRIFGESSNPKSAHALPLMTAVIVAAWKQSKTEDVASFLIAELCARTNADTMLKLGKSFSGMSRWLMMGNARFILANGKDRKNKEYKQNALHFLTGALGASINSHKPAGGPYIPVLFKLIVDEKQSLKDAANSALDEKLNDIMRRNDTGTIPLTQDD